MAKAIYFVSRNSRSGILASMSILLVIFVAANLYVTPPEMASAKVPRSPSSLKLQVLDCGYIYSKQPEVFGVTMEEVGGNADMPTPCYLIRHPKGILLFDTGLGDFRHDKPKENLSGFLYHVPVTLASQLRRLRLKPAQIKYVAISHMHSDHIGNFDLFPQSTFLIQRAELLQIRVKPFMYTPKSALDRLQQPGIEPIDGDYDVFRDGSVVLMATPGHTPGHQSLVVRLPRTGTIVLSGDLYHYMAEAKLRKMPTSERSTETPTSRARVEALLRKEHGQLWVGHDIETYRAMRKAPAFYE